MLPLVLIDRNSRSLPVPEASLLVARDGEQVEKILGDASLRLSGILVDPAIPGAHRLSGIPLIQYIHRQRPVTPIYLLHDSETPPLSAREMSRLAIHRSLRKPLEPEQLRDLRRASLPPAPASDVSEELVANPGGDSADFIPVPIQDFVPDVRFFFDVYVLVPAERFVKVLRAGDSFTIERLQGYMARGAGHLYLKRFAVERCLDYAEVLSRFLLRSPGVSPQWKMTQVLNQGESALAQIRESGALTPDAFDSAVKFVTNVRVALRQMSARDAAPIKALLSDPTAYDHSIGTTMIAYLVSRELGIEADEPWDSFGLAAFLHDIGLLTKGASLEAELRGEDPARMSSRAKWLYETHPLDGAEVLARFDPAPPDAVIQAVAQHHERRDSSGFPRRVAPGEINRIAEVIGISDELIQRLHRGMKLPSPELKRDLEETVYQGFSLDVVRAFMNAMDL